MNQNDYLANLGKSQDYNINVDHGRPLPWLVVHEACVLCSHTVHASWASHDVLDK